MIDIRYFLILLAWVILLIGFYFQSYEISAISAMFLMAIGVWLARSGLESIDVFLTSGLAAIMILMGAYVFIRGTWQQYSTY